MPDSVLVLTNEDMGGGEPPGHAGLPLYLDLAKVVGLSRSIQRHLWVRHSGQGCMDGRVVMALVMLNLAGGEHVEDLRGLEEDVKKKGSRPFFRWKRTCCPS